MAINSFLNCSTDCDATVALPAIPANQLCTSYTQRYSQILGIVLQPAGSAAPFDCSGANDCTTPVTQVAEVIDNSDATGAKSKYLVGEGGIAAPEKITDEYPGRRSRTSFRTYTLTLNVKNLECTSYDFLRALQCGSTDFRLYYTTVGGWLFGCDGGIEVSSIDVDFVYGEGREDKEYAVVTVTWDADGEPNRHLAPARLLSPGDVKEPTP